MVKRTNPLCLTKKTNIMWQRRNKFNVSPKENRTCDGITFDSKKEMAYYQELLLRKKAKDITDFTMQTPFVFTLGGKKMFTYFADFVVNYKNGDQEIIDVKGFLTPLFRLKRKIIEQEYQIKIKTV